MEIAYSLYFRVLVVPILIFIVPELVCVLVSLVRIMLKKKAAWIYLFIAIFFAIDSVIVFKPSGISTAAQVVKDIGAQSCYAEGLITKVQDGGLYEHGTHQGWWITVDHSPQKFFVFDVPNPQYGQQIQFEYLPNSHVITQWEEESVIHNAS